VLAATHPALLHRVVVAAPAAVQAAAVLMVVDLHHMAAATSGVTTCHDLSRTHACMHTIHWWHAWELHALVMVERCWEALRDLEAL
jgi:hypothetical protein